MKKFCDVKDNQIEKNLIKNSSELLNRDVYCLAPFSALSHIYLQIQDTFPSFKGCPYVPVVYHLIPYLLYGESIFFNTAEFINKHFTKDGPIILLSSEQDYPREELSALAYNLAQSGFKNLTLKTVARGILGSLVDADFQIDFPKLTPHIQAAQNKQWWIDQLWFRWFLRVSRVSVVALFFLIPIFVLRTKNF